MFSLHFPEGMVRNISQPISMTKGSVVHPSYNFPINIFLKNILEMASSASLHMSTNMNDFFSVFVSKFPFLYIISFSKFLFPLMATYLHSSLVLHSRKSYFYLLRSLNFHDLV